MSTYVISNVTIYKKNFFLRNYRLSYYVILIACPSSCADCALDSSTATTKCSKCVPDYVLDNGQCVKSCPAGKVISPDDQATCIGMNFR